MSRFIDRLKRTSDGGPKPMGFTARQTAHPGPKMQIVAAIGAENAAGAVAGADAELLSFSKSADAAAALQKLAATGTIPGARLSNGSQNEVKQLSKAGADFVVFTASTPLTAAENGKDLGKVLELEPSVEAAILRTANEIPVDAVLIAAGEKETSTLTFHDLMLFRRFADLLTKPLLVPVPPQVTGGELQALWDIGVSGVVINASGKQAAERIAALREEVDNLDFSPRRSKAGGALLPRPGHPSRHRDEDEDDEDDE